MSLTIEVQMFTSTRHRKAYAYYRLTSEEVTADVSDYLRPLLRSPWVGPYDTKDEARRAAVQHMKERIA